MNIIIHRGQNQIGGSIIEIASDTARIILDAGMELDEKTPAAPEIEGLFCGTPGYDAVFISHYHGDHIGLLDQVLPGIPAYIGEKAARVTNAARAYLKKPLYRFDGFYQAGQACQIGDLRITPYLCDHSAFDAYMFHVACNGTSILYTGDFRANGRKSFPALLNRLPHADTLIIEGTVLSREERVNRTEVELEAQAVEAMRSTAGPVFVMMAATNIDRLVTIYKAARKTGRLLLEDVYLANVATAAGDNIPNPKTFANVRAFTYSGDPARYEDLNAFGRRKINRANIAQSRYAMCVRASMEGYLEKLSALSSFTGGLLLYSMWDGYRVNEDTARFLRFMEAQGVTVLPLHTSGHADAQTIDRLIRTVAPKTILPVHTENAGWFRRYEGMCTVRPGIPTSIEQE